MVHRVNSTYEGMITSNNTFETYVTVVYHSKSGYLERLSYFYARVHCEILQSITQTHKQQYCSMQVSIPQ